MASLGTLLTILSFSITQLLLVLLGMSSDECELSDGVDNALYTGSTLLDLLFFGSASDESLDDSSDCTNIFLDFIFSSALLGELLDELPDSNKLFCFFRALFLSVFGGESSDELLDGLSDANNFIVLCLWARMGLRDEPEESSDEASLPSKFSIALDGNADWMIIFR